MIYYLLNIDLLPLVCSITLRPSLCYLVKLFKRMSLSFSLSAKIPVSGVIDRQSIYIPIPGNTIYKGMVAVDLFRQHILCSITREIGDITPAKKNRDAVEYWCV